MKNSLTNINYIFISIIILFSILIACSKTETCPNKCIYKKWIDAHNVGKVYIAGHYENFCNNFCRNKNQVNVNVKNIQEDEIKRINSEINKEILEEAKKIVLERKERKEYERLKLKFENGNVKL